MIAVGGANTTWAVVVIVLIPMAIIAGAELDERLRQRESSLRPAATTLRTWGLPLFALWALLRPVLGVEDDALSVRIATTGLLVSIAVALLRTVAVVIDRTRRRMNAGGRRQAPELLLMLPRLAIVIATGWVLVQAVWGVNLSAALTALGVTSLVISFALQDTLSGLASGLLLLGDQPIQPGDWVRIGSIDGMVVDINWRTTRIRDRNGDLNIVPNSELANSTITNHSAGSPVHRVVVPVQVAFVNPPTAAKEMLLDAARSTEGVLLDPPPQVVVTQTDDPLMGYEVHLWIDDYAIAPRVKSDFGGLVWYQSHRHGVPLPSPAQDLFLHDAKEAAAAGVPTHADLLGALSGSPLLASSTDDDLDRLARAASLARYAVGELITAASDTTRELVVLVEGTADVVLPAGIAGGREQVAGSLSAGEIAGFVTADPDAPAGLAVRARSDCVVAVVDGQVVEEMASRRSEFAAALTRLAAGRRRRAERVAARVAAAHAATAELGLPEQTTDRGDA